MKIFDMEQLKKHAVENPIGWLVEDLFREASFNICAGGPKTGKSSLLRHLAAAVTKGESFLGEPTKQGEVLYICPDEADTSSLSFSFERLGVTGGLYVACYDVTPDSLTEEIREFVAAHPKVKLVVLDTLGRTVGLEDLNDYAKTIRDLDPILTLAAECKLTIIGVHHTNKRTAATVAGGLMGSHGIASVVSTCLEILEDHTGRRFLRGIRRNGGDYEKTELNFDTYHQTFTLGQTEADKAEEKSLTRVSYLRNKLLDYIVEHPGCAQAQIVKAVTGSPKAVICELGNMKSDGLIRSDGTGRKGSPFAYYPAEVILEAA